MRTTGEEHAGIPGRLFRRAARPLYLRLRRVFSRAADRYLGTTTTDEDVARALHQDVVNYRATNRALGWTSCWRLLKTLRASANEVLLDVGCGAGRVVSMAARRGYVRVIGVERSARIVFIAARNARHLRQPHAPIEIVHADATTYNVPDDVTVVFLYNPFQGAVFDAALNQILASWDRRPRHLTVAYGNPIEHDRLLTNHRLRPARRIQLSWRPGKDWNRTQAVQLYDIVG